MYPFSYTGLRLLHDEKVRDAMEKASVDAMLAGDAQRTGRLSSPGRVLLHVRSRLNLLAKPYSRIMSSRLR